jgi:hypothetical protein
MVRFAEVKKSVAVIFFITSVLKECNINFSGGHYKAKCAGGEISLLAIDYIGPKQDIVEAVTADQNKAKAS